MDGGTGRGRGGHVGAIDGIDSGEVGEIGKEDRRFDDRRSIESGLVEDREDVLTDAMGLGFDATGDKGSSGF